MASGGSPVGQNLGLRIKRPSMPFPLQELGIGLRTEGTDLKETDSRPPTKELKVLTPVDDSDDEYDLPVAAASDYDDDLCKGVFSDESDCSSIDGLVLDYRSKSNSTSTAEISESSSESGITIDMKDRKNHRSRPSLTETSSMEEDQNAGGDEDQGLTYGKKEQLLEFVEDLPNKERNQGISVWNGLKTSFLQYEEGKQFKEICDLQPHGSPSQKESIFLCQDLTSKETFVLKKVFTRNYILPGLVFLVQHDGESFLPKIYAVYKKEKGIVWIFMEHIKGETVNNRTVDWTPSQIVVFTEFFLKAVQFLHDKGLAHCDLKPANVMIRDRNNPKSLVIIDFESARHKDGPFIKGGQGHTTTYLPPFLKALPETGFSDILMGADLWAVVCIVVTLLMRSTWYHQLQNEKRQKQSLQMLGVRSRSRVSAVRPSGSDSIWAEKKEKLMTQCNSCNHGSQFCSYCTALFKDFLETHGYGILQVHLGDVMEREAVVDDPCWPCLRDLLGYLTNPDHAGNVNATTALSFLQ